MREPAAVSYGYTMADLHRFTVVAVAGNRCSIPADQQYENAWNGIVDALLDADTRPAPGRLVQAGRLAVLHAIAADRAYHGVARGGSGLGTAPRFAAYWTPATTASPEGPIVERHALAQILPRLLPYQRRVLDALATTGDYQAAAALLGISPGVFRNYVSRARRAFFALWCQGETPPKRRADRRRGGPLRGAAAERAAQTSCKHGHPFDKANTYIEPKTGRRGCRTCRARHGRNAYLRSRAAA